MLVAMADEPIRAYQKVSCLCGAQIRVDPSSTDRRVTCPSCGSNFDFVVTLDPGRKRSKVSIVLPRAAMKTEGESLGKASGKPAASKTAAPKNPEPKAAPPPPPPPTPSRVTRKVSPKTVYALTGNCECGTVFPLFDTGELATVQACPECNRAYHVVFKLEPGTRKKTAILVPDKLALPKSRTLAAPPKPPKGATRTGKTAANDPGSRVTDFFTPGGKKRTQVTKARTKTPPEIPPGAQGVPCPCGELFVVRRRDVGRSLTCGGCGKTASFEEARDPQSLAPIIRIKL